MTIGRNSPKYIGQKLGTEVGGSRQFLDVELDLHVTNPAIYLGCTFRLRSQRRPLKVDLGPAATVAITNGLNGAGHDFYFENRIGAPRRVAALVRLSRICLLCRKQRRRAEQ